MAYFTTADAQRSFARQTLDAYNRGELDEETAAAVEANLIPLQSAAGGYTGSEGSLSVGPGSTVIGGENLPNGGRADGLAQWAAENDVSFSDAYNALGGGSPLRAEDINYGGGAGGGGGRDSGYLLDLLQAGAGAVGNAAPFETANTSVDWGGNSGGGGGFNKPTLIPGSTATYEPMVQFANNTGQYNQSADPYQWLDAVKQRYPQPEQVFRQPGPILPQNTPSGFSQNTQGPDMPIRQTGLPPAPTQVDNGTAYPQQGGMADNKTRRQKDLLSGYM